jgi:tetratricopeptide (TPR) repeat protein
MFSAHPLVAVRAFWASLREHALPRGELARGLRAIEGGRFEEAQAALALALGEAPDAPARALVHNKLGVAYVAAGRRAEGLEAFAEALACDPSCAAALTNIGNLLLEDGHLEDAIDHYDAAIVANDRYALAYRNLGIALRRAGRRDASVSALRKADRLEARPLRRRV